MGIGTRQIEADLRSTRDLLLLVGIKATLVGLRELSGWEREQAANWAVSMHLAASDNRRTAKPKPRCLLKFPGVAR